MTDKITKRQQAVLDVIEQYIREGNPERCVPDLEIA